MRVSAGNGKQFFEAKFHVVHEFLDVNSAEFRCTVADVDSKAGVHLSSPRQVSTFEVKQADGRMDHALKERPFGANKLGPEVFEDIVAGEEFLLIKQLNAFVNSAIAGVE